MMNGLNVECIICGAYEENAYIVSAEGRSDAVVIDPGDLSKDQLDKIINGTKKIGAILLTHAHFDHTLSAGAISKAFDAPIYVHAADLDMVEDILLNEYKAADAVLPPPSNFGAVVYPANDGETLDICGMHFVLMHTPGHSPGGVCLYNEQSGVLLSGDTMFAGAFGRVDLAGGSPMKMRSSLRKLLALPADTKVYAGHMQPTTIGQERLRYHS